MNLVADKLGFFYATVQGVSCNLNSFGFSWVKDTERKKRSRWRKSSTLYFAKVVQFLKKNTVYITMMLSQYNFSQISQRKFGTSWTARRAPNVITTRRRIGRRQETLSGQRHWIRCVDVLRSAYSRKLEGQSGFSQLHWSKYGWLSRSSIIAWQVISKNDEKRQATRTLPDVSACAFFRRNEEPSGNVLVSCLSSIITSLVMCWYTES